MTNAPQSSSAAPGANWQLIGETELPARADGDGMLQRWLEETLLPLGLNERVFNQIFALVRQAQAGLRAAPGGETCCMQLRIYAPAGSLPGGQCWGFFRTEKKDGAPAQSQATGHLVAFYLYPE